MAHPRDSLRSGEKVILDTRPHWWYFARPAGLLVVSILVALMILVSSDNFDRNSVATTEASESVFDFENAGNGINIGGSLDGALQFLASILIIFAIVLMIVTTLTWYFTHFFISNQRIVLRSGILNREGVEIPIDRVNTVFFEQNFVERLVGAGDVLVESAGESGVQRFFDIANPLAVKERLRKQIDNTKKKQSRPQPAPRVPSAPEPQITSITDKIRDLNDLRLQEIITEEEFAAKKAELLSQI